MRSTNNRARIIKTGCLVFLRRSNNGSRSKLLGNDSLMSSIGQSTYTTATKATATTAASTATATK